MSEYWNGRFREGGRIWGLGASVTAAHAEQIFRSRGVKSILVPGSGYGRNAEWFSKIGYSVTGIETAETALALVPPGSTVKYIQGSVLDMPIDQGARYDAIYCFNVLHLFQKADRKLFIDKCRGALAENGIAFFVVFSEQESQFGKGRRLEENTFESKPGRPVHFFTREDLVESFRGFSLIETGIMEDTEDHGAQGPHAHKVRYICASMKPAHDFDGEKYAKASGHQKEWGRLIISELSLRGNERVLDLGCGDGALTAELALRVPQGSVLGIDASRGMIDKAKEKESGVLQFRLLNIEDMDFKDELDLIFSNATLHWVKDHEGLLARCGRALKDGGLLRFNFAGDGNCSGFIRTVREVMGRKAFSAFFSGFEWPWFMPRVKEYEALLSKCSPFKDCKVWEENADRLFTRDELVKWIGQPSIVPFLTRLPEKQKAAFRDAVVEEMIDLARREENRYFETFRRINVEARK
jgi:trans-aconitate 2-methyltransferase